jgi:hypothetical protein
MPITTKDIKAGPATLEHKLSPELVEQLPKKSKLSAVDHFCLGYLCQKNAKQEAALKHYKHVADQWAVGEPAFYARYSAGIIAQNLNYPWPKVEHQFLGAFQTLPQRGEPILRIIHYYQSKQQWPIAYLFSKFAKEQFYGKLPTNGNWGLDKSLYNWKILDIHKVSCYYVQEIDEATATYSILCRLITEDPDSFLAEDITRIARQKFLFPGFASYEKDRTQYHLQ